MALTMGCYLLNKNATAKTWATLFYATNTQGSFVCRQRFLHVANRGLTLGGAQKTIVYWRLLSYTPRIWEVNVMMESKYCTHCKNLYSPSGRISCWGCKNYYNDKFTPYSETKVDTDAQPETSVETQEFPDVQDRAEKVGSADFRISFEGVEFNLSVYDVTAGFVSDMAAQLLSTEYEYEDEDEGGSENKWRGVCAENSESAKA
jgi:hypothetical protein